MARKTLFAYTRKRVYDQLLLRYTVFCVKQENKHLDSVTFEYDSVFLGIVHYYPDVQIATWLSDDDAGIVHTCKTRLEINRLLDDILAPVKTAGFGGAK